MKVVAFDTETHLIQPGLAAPPLVCGSMVENGCDARLLDADGARAEFRRLLESDDVIAGANIAYDMIVMAVDATRRGEDLLPAIFAKYDRGQVYDVQIAETLHAIGRGHLGMRPDGSPMLDAKGRHTTRYSLDNCVRLVLGRDDAKANDYWRLRYALLENTPIDEWPDAARDYPIDDAVNTLQVALAQRAGHENQHDEPFQTFKAFCLALGGAWGLRADGAAVAELESAALLGRESGRQRWVDRGFLVEKRIKGEDKFVENQTTLRIAVAEAYGCTGLCAACGGKRRAASSVTGKPINCNRCNATGIDLDSAPVPRTAPSAPSEKFPEGKFPWGQVQIGRDILSESGDEELADFAAYKEDDKILNSYLPFVKQGIDAPITLRPNPVLDTGRVSYDGLIQTLPRQVSAHLASVLARRGSRLSGVRDCFVARPGYVYYSNDYQGGELVTFAESALARVGFSKMGEALNAGIDVHSDVAAGIMGIPYDEFRTRYKAGDKICKAVRQAAKPIDFGAGGGIGAPKIVLQQRKQGPDTEWPDGPSDLGGGRRGYKGLRFCLLMGRADRCGEKKVTSWGRTQLPPTCSECIIAASSIRDALFARYSEFRPYLDWHASNVDNVGYSIQHYSGRKRAGVNFCSASNGDFQALLAEIVGRALIRVTYEQYCVRDSPLWGSRGIVLPHDELFGEAPEETAAEAAERVSEIMVEEFRKGCPNHAAACKAEPTIMRRWYKAAEMVRDDSGRLIPWEPE